MSCLNPEDLTAMAKRWITPEIAVQAGIYRVDSIEGARLVGRNSSGDYSGLAIPNILPGQTRPREFRLRRDNPELKPDGREANKYLSPPGRGNLLYFISGTSEESLKEVRLPIVFVEGEFKNLALWRLAHHETTPPRWLSIGIPGCWSWRGIIGKAPGPNGAPRDVKGTIADLDRIIWDGRRVYLVPDSNVVSNSSVAAAWREFGKELSRRGAEVVVVEMPRDTKLNGIDDLLALWGPGRVLELFKRAQARSTVKDFHRSDLGNAQRLVARHGRDLRYVTAWNGWAVWDGCRWKRDDMLEAENRAKETVQSLYAEVAKLSDEDERKKMAGFALASESAFKIRAMLQMAKSEVAARAEDFDTDPDLLTFLNGTLHLPTSELRTHRQSDNITKLVNYRYLDGTPCTAFLKFIHEVMGGQDDQDRARRLVTYLQVAFGYSLTGQTREKVAFVLHGAGDNGKTTLLNCFRELIEEHSLVLQIDSLMGGRWDKSNAQADLADLQGTRFAMTSETDSEQHLSEGRLKRITQGMGKIRAVRKYENPITFPETHKLWLDCNHRPSVKDDGNAIWKRLHLIPFDVVITKDRQDKELSEKLRAEAEGILAWAVEGARKWYEEGLTKPAEVDAATQAWREENDLLEAFLSECCIRKSNARVSKTHLYQTYKSWNDNGGLQSETKIRFGKKLVERGFDDYSDGNTRYWLGLGLLTDDPDR